MYSENQEDPKYVFPPEVMEVLQKSLEAQLKEMVYNRVDHQVRLNLEQTMRYYVQDQIKVLLAKEIQKAVSEGFREKVKELLDQTDIQKLVDKCFEPTVMWELRRRIVDEFNKALKWDVA